MTEFEMAALVSGGVVYLLKIKKETQKQIQNQMNSGLREIKMEDIKKIFPELEGYKIVESDGYAVDTARRVLMLPKSPKQVFVAHEAGHAQIHARNKGLKRLLKNIRYVYYPISEEKEAWEYARQYADSGEDVDKIKKPFLKSYKISFVSKAAMMLLSAAVAILYVNKREKGNTDAR